MNSNHYCVILAGGSDRNFWPMGRDTKPLQFLNIAGTSESFLRATVNRCKRIFSLDNILITTLAKYKDLVLEQIPEIPAENIIVEPYARQTSACIAYANYCILKRNPNAVVTITPSDLLIFNQIQFEKDMETVLNYCTTFDKLAIIGINPDHPDTNYGYIQATAAYGEDLLQAKTFTEKPTAEMAEIFIASGEFYWNSGIYTWKADVIREELDNYVPEVTARFNGWENALGSPYESEFIEKAYMSCPNISIELSILEKTQRAMVHPADFGWADIGNWGSLYASYPDKDENGNAINTKSVIKHNCKDCLVITKDPEKLVAIHGLSNYMIVDTENALLVCPKEGEKFRDIVSELGLPELGRFK